MLRATKILGRLRDWQLVVLAGVLGFAATLVAMLTVVDAYSVSFTSLSIALAAATGALLGVSLVGSITAWRVRQALSEQNMQLDGAINNMNQGLCMFDAQNRLLVWNERYRTMYNIDPKRIRHGCTIRDLLDARVASGMFPLNPERYDRELRAALQQGKCFTLEIELSDGRIIAVVNQPIKGGGWVATHEDVTERKRAVRELEHTRTFLDTIIENVPSPILVKNIPDLKYILVNRAAEQCFGVDRSLILGKTAQQVMPVTSGTYIDAQDQRLMEVGKPLFVDEHAIITPANGTRIVSSTRLPVAGPDGRPQYLITVIHDVTERKRDEQRIAHMAHHDVLTDLPNRAAFNECIAATIDIARKSQEDFALLSVDLDRFQTVNDVYGYAVGDQLLREVASRMALACEGAFVARVGGDEFHVITPTGPQPVTVETLAGKLMAAFDSDIEVDGFLLRVPLTIGVAIFPQDGDDPVNLIANADAALFRAKSEARGTIHFFEMAMDKKLREKRALQQDLRAAIAREELTLHYQPYTTIDGEPLGFEALARWNHPAYGMISPEQFIPLAEESGLIVTMGEWILRTACREAAAWPRPLRISVNLSPVQFRQGDLVALVHSILLETGLEPGRLKLEITEGVLIDDFARGLSVLRRLKYLGVRIAMDDFGSGYSSMSYLQAFPFDKIKIDRSFVANLPHNQQSAAIVRAVIGLAHGLDLPVVAEGVETEAQLKFLAGENCDEVQGYLIGQPKPIEHYAAVIGHRYVPARQALAG
jgi:diguanylate cyclase (GGDEF)-like protein/PAS domain S-box-containing protein